MYRTKYAYDASGNLETHVAPAGALTTNTWDAENRLTLVEAPSSVVNTMTYNAAGLRAQKEDSAGTSKFIWDGQKILLETDSADTTQELVKQSKKLADGDIIPHFDDSVVLRGSGQGRRLAG